MLYWKKIFVRGHNTPFINREFQKEIYMKSRLKNKFWVQSSVENKAAYKNMEISASK